MRSRPSQWPYGCPSSFHSGNARPICRWICIPRRAASPLRRACRSGYSMPGGAAGALREELASGRGTWHIQSGHPRRGRRTGCRTGSGGEQAPFVPAVFPVHLAQQGARACALPLWAWGTLEQLWAHQSPAAAPEPRQAAAYRRQRKNAPGFRPLFRRWDSGEFSCRIWCRIWYRHWLSLYRLDRSDPSHPVLHKHILPNREP